jgi:hypothetical protein
LRFELDLPAGGIGPGQALTYRMAENTQRPGAFKRVTLEPDVEGFGGGFYEDSSNVLSIPQDDLTSGDFHIYLNPRIKGDNDTDPHERSSYVNFRLYSLSGTDEISDLLEWESFISLGRIAGYNEDYYHYGLMPVVYESSSSSGSDPDEDSYLWGGANWPGFGIEASLQFPEVAAYENASSPLARSKMRIYADYNLRSTRQRGDNDLKTYVGYAHFTELDVQNLYPPSPSAIGPRDWIAGGVVDNMVLFDIPATYVPLHSIGQLSQVNLADSAFAPNYQVGNSRPNAFLPASSLYAFDDNVLDGEGLADWSYLANDLLWDRYFFSTYRPDTPDAPVWHPQYLLEEDAASDTSVLEDPALAAAHLIVDGMFNVNSTSVEAWKILLGAFYGESQSVGTGVGGEVADNESPFLRFQFPLTHSYDDYDGTGTGLPVDKQLYGGYRKLTRAEITTLAEHIVEEVKKRGPFLSMAEFVNRKFDPDSHLSVADDATVTELADEPELMGALQAAIEKSGLNARLNRGESYRKPGDTYLAYRSDGTTYPANRGCGAGSLFQDAPGYFSQIDILSRLGSILSARSDTFVIRSYGQANNPLTGKVEGEAWLEAVVERTLTPIEPDEDNPYESADPQQFGRKFKIVAFRWLGRNDI